MLSTEQQAANDAGKEYLRLYGAADAEERNRLDNYLDLGKASYLSDAETDAAILKQHWPYIPESFDFNAVSKPPDWLIRGLLERSTVNILSGDTGAAKSIHSASLACSVLHGTDWLRWEAPKVGKVLYLDGENPERVTHDRLRGLGITNADHDSLVYFRRGGMSFIPGTDSMTGLCEFVARFKPDLVILDTVMSLLNVEVNDNDAVVRLYRDLRTVAEEFPAAWLLNHHERKPMANEKRQAGYSMMGARQWAGQADVHLTLAAASDYVETELEDAHGATTEKAFTLKCEKFRDGGSSAAERTFVRGLKTPHPDSPKDYVLVNLSVEYGGKVRDETSEAELLAQQIGPKMSSDPRNPGMVAESVGKTTGDSTFKAAMKWIEGEGYSVTEGTTRNRKTWLTDAGIAWVAGLGQAL